MRGPRSRRAPRSPPGPGASAAASSPDAPVRRQRARGWNRRGGSVKRVPGPLSRLLGRRGLHFFFFPPPRSTERRTPHPGASEEASGREGTEGAECRASERAARGGDWKKLIFLARPPSLRALPRPLLAAPPRRRPPLAEPRSLLRGSPGGSGGRNTHTYTHTLTHTRSLARTHTHARTQLI